MVNQPGDSATCGGIRNRQDKVPHFRHARSVEETEETGRLPVAGQSPHVFGQDGAGDTSKLAGNMIVVDHTCVVLVSGRLY